MSLLLQSIAQDDHLPSAMQLPGHQEAAPQLLEPDPNPPEPPKYLRQLSTASAGHDSRARRRPALESLRQLQSSLSSNRHCSPLDSPREVRFISPAPSATPADFPQPPLQPPLLPQTSYDPFSRVMQDSTGTSPVGHQEGSSQQPRHQPARALSRLTSSMKQSLPKPSLRRRSFNRQASSVSFAPTVSGNSDSSHDEDTSRNTFAQSFAQPGLAVAPVLRTVSSVWQAISSMGRGAGSTPVPPPMYQLAQPNSPELDESEIPSSAAPDFPSSGFRPPATHPGKPPRSALLWQKASRKAVAGLPPADSAATSTPHGRPPSRFGSFWGAVAQAAVKQPTPQQQAARAHASPNALSQEHLALGVQLLLQARQRPSRLSSSASLGAGQQGLGTGARGRQPSLANVVRALSTAWQLDPAASMGPTSPVSMVPTLSLPYVVMHVQESANYVYVQ